jgi:hypothetical protein
VLEDNCVRPVDSLCPLSLMRIIEKIFERKGSSSIIENSD